MAAEEAQLQEEGGLSDMIDSLKAKRADGEAPTPDDASDEGGAPSADDPDHVDDTTNLSIDQRLILSGTRAKRELKRTAVDSDLAEGAWNTYAKQATLVQTDAKLRFDRPGAVEFNLADDEQEDDEEEDVEEEDDVEYADPQAVMQRRYEQYQSESSFQKAQRAAQQ